MKPAVRFLIVIAILLVTFGLPVALQSVIDPSPVTPTSTPTPNITSVEVNDDLRFLSVPPVLAPVNSTFMYKMVVASISGDKVTIEVLSKPDWLSWDAIAQQLFGTVPNVGGVFTVSMRATTPNGASADQTFTVTMDQSEVKGISTVGIWKDPFHPNQADIAAASETYLSEITDSSAVLGETVVSNATEEVENSWTQMLAEYRAVGLIGFLGVIASVVVFWSVRSSANSKKMAQRGVVIERGTG